MWESVTFAQRFDVLPVTSAAALFRLVGAILKQTRYSARMRFVRKTIKWTYMKIEQYFASHDFKSQLNVRKVSVVLLFKGATTPCNLEVFNGHGGQVKSFFECSSPSLQNFPNEYI